MRETIHPQLLRQPHILYFLFSVELWERFSFYIVRGLLVLYLVKIFLFSDARSYNLFATFTALLWLSVPLGQFMIERFISQGQALIMGTTAFVIGYALLVVPIPEALYVGLAFITIAHGLCRPCTTQLFQRIYAWEGDPRREPGLAVYRFGINLGGMAAALSCGLIVWHWGWQAAFATASAGSLIGLVVFLSGRSIVEETVKIPNGHSYGWQLLIYSILAITVLFIYTLLYHTRWANLLILMLGSLLALLALIEVWQFSHQRRRMLIGRWLLITLFIFFGILLLQSPMMLTLFTERCVNRHMWGFYFPTVMYQAITPFFIIIFTPLFAFFLRNFKWLNQFFSMPIRLICAVLFMGLSFLILGIASLRANLFVASYWLFIIYALQAFAELLLHPFFLAILGYFAKRENMSFLIAYWLSSLAIASAAAAWIAKLTDVSQTGTHILSQIIWQYADVFTVLGAFILFIVIVAFIQYRGWTKLVKEDELFRG